MMERKMGDKYLETAGTGTNNIADGSCVNFGMAADAHLMGPDYRLDDEDFTRHSEYFENFLGEMRNWEPDFIVDLGDFACQASNHPTDREKHDRQLAGLKKHVKMLQSLPCAVYHVMGNHDCGWVDGADEKLRPEDLWQRAHRGEDITKHEFLAATRMPGRFYSFFREEVLFIFLDGCGTSPQARDGSPPPGTGSFWIDEQQIQWLDGQLRKHRDRMKIIFCHQPLLPNFSSGCFPETGKGQADPNFVENGRQVHRMLRANGGRAVCISGHTHKNHHYAEQDIHHVILTGLFLRGGFTKAAVTADMLILRGFGDQADYRLKFPRPAS